MVQRQTIADDLEIFSIASNIFERHGHASLLVDKAGTEPAKGTITAVSANEMAGECSIKLDNKTSILVKEIIGINRIFRSDYTEC